MLQDARKAAKEEREAKRKAEIEKKKMEKERQREARKKMVSVVSMYFCCGCLSVMKNKQTNKQTNKHLFSTMLNLATSTEVKYVTRYSKSFLKSAPTCV